jgi:hypothetical protein
VSLAERIRMPSVATPEAVASLEGTVCQKEDWDLLLGKGSAPTRVYSADGKLVAVYLPKALAGDDSFSGAYEALHEVRKRTSDNRGTYAVTAKSDWEGETRAWDGKRYRNINPDGTLSRSTRAATVSSAIVGYFGRDGRFKYCRETAFTAQDRVRWDTLVPLCERVHSLMRKHVRRRCLAQEQFVGKIPSAYTIAGTPFTTLTVNNSVSAGYHFDAGDYRPGFGAMTYYRRGEYTGGELCFPRHRFAIDAQDGDVIFFDPHEMHGMPLMEGVGPKMLPEQGGWERISVVFYARENMKKCLPPKQELERARKRAEELAARPI